MGFFNAIVIICLICGIGGLILFSKLQLILKQPMLEIRTLKYPIFSLGLILTLILYMIPFSINIILPTYFQTSMGLTPFASGVALLPGCVANIILTPISGRLYDKIGIKPLVVTGFAIMAVAMFFLSHISVSTTLSLIVAFYICIFIGFSLICTPLQTNTLNQLPKEYNSHGVAIFNTVQQIASAFGSSLFIGLMGAVQIKYLSNFKNPDISQQHAAIISGVDIAFTAALILVVIALILTFFIKGRKKESNEFS